MKHYTALLASFIVLSLVLPSIAQAAMTALPTVDSNSLTQAERDRIFRPCKNVDSREVERCQNRQLSRAVVQWGRSTPTGAEKFYDEQDWGQHKMRARADTERRQKFRADVLKNRKTYGEFTPTEDLNTERLPYINDVRLARLKCMYVAKGRPRALCFDKAGNEARQNMGIGKRRAASSASSSSSSLRFSPSGELLP